MGAAEIMKARLRADLKAAMQNKRAVEMKTLRMLLGAIDNAEAVPVEQPRTYVTHAFGAGTAEVARRNLSDEDLQALLAREIASRRATAEEMTRLGRPDRAEPLTVEAAIIAQYLR